MDLRIYYQKIRKIEAAIPEESVVIISGNSGWRESREEKCSRGGRPHDRGRPGGTGYGGGGGISKWRKRRAGRRRKQRPISLRLRFARCAGRKGKCSHMALLTDGNPNTTEELRVYESSILDVAHVEAIDLDSKMTLATEEISEDVLDILIDQSRNLIPFTDQRRHMGVSDVVVTRQLKRWHALHSLELLYRDAFNNQLNDRYRAKWIEYQELSRNARYQRCGSESESSPCRSRKQSPRNFRWLPARHCRQRITPRLPGFLRRGRRAPQADVTALTTPDGSVMVVTAVDPPPNAVAFNVYAGLTADSLTLQNATPVPGSQSFTMAPGDPVPGRAPGIGQEPDQYIVGGSMLRRG